MTKFWVLESLGSRANGLGSDRMHRLASDDSYPARQSSAECLYQTIKFRRDILHLF